MGAHGGTWDVGWIGMLGCSAVKPRGHADMRIGGHGAMHANVQMYRCTAHSAWGWGADEGTWQTTLLEQLMLMANQLHAQ